MSARAAWAALLALPGLVACGIPAAVAGPSAFALPLLEPGPAPRLVLGQRAITRAWGPSDDSTYVEVSLPEWKSEGWAAVMSGIVPGAGHYYVGEGSAFAFALAEAAGWIARAVFDRKADDVRDDAVAFAGNPADSASAWSFARWELVNGASSELRALYEADRDAFYNRIASDPAFAAGWRESAEATRLGYKSIYDRSQRFEKRSRYAGAALWINHVVAAVDALRAARNHNLPLRRDLEFKLRSSWRDGPAIEARLVRRF